MMIGRMRSAPEVLAFKGLLDSADTSRLMSGAVTVMTESVIAFSISEDAAGSVRTKCGTELAAGCCRGINVFSIVSAMLVRGSEAADEVGRGVGLDDPDRAGDEVGIAREGNWKSSWVSVGGGIGASIADTTCGIGDGLWEGGREEGLYGSPSGRNSIGGSSARPS